MRLLSVNHTADLYGASRCLERIATRFVRDGHELFVVLPKAGPLKDTLERNGITVLLHPLLSVVDRNTTRTWRDKLWLALSFPFSVAWLAWTILRLRIDLVHTNSGVVFSPACAAKLTGKPHVWHIREFFVEFPSYWQRYQRMMYALSNTILAMSVSLRDQFSATVQKKVEVIYDGLPEDEFYAPDIAAEAAAFRNRYRIEGRLSAGVIGRLKWVRKGQEVFIRAAGLLKDKYPDALFFVIGTAAPGSEDHLARFKALAAEVGLPDRVIFTGDIADPRPAHLGLDVTVAPSVDPEPFGCIVMESMALGTPVIASNAAGFAEQIVNGETGFLFAPGNHVQLAEALDKLFADEQLRHEFGRRGRERYLQHFEIEESYRQHLKVFRALADRDSNRSLAGVNT